MSPTYPSSHYFPSSDLLETELYLILDWTPQTCVPHGIGAGLSPCGLF